jgi:hypothetical protein
MSGKCLGRMMTPSCHSGPEARLPVTLLLACLVVTSLAAGQTGSAGTGGKIEPRFIVDMPTAGMQGGRTLSLDLDTYDDGGVLLRVGYGIVDRLSLAVSYGGTGLLGSGTPTMNDVPGVAVKIRVADEAMTFPALSVGFDSQGKDAYISSLKRYTIKSPGLFAVMSKNYLLAGFFSLHGGVNYSFESADGNRGMNFFVGAEKTIGSFLSLLGEYNAGLNDSDRGTLGRGRGYLNCALNLSLGGGVTLGLEVKDILENQRTRSGVLRCLHLEYVH